MDIVERLIVYRDRPGHSRDDRELLADVANEINFLRKEKQQLRNFFAGLKNIIEELLQASGVVLFVAFIAWSVPARATPSCMTYAEARAAFHTSHLWWHSMRHCWDDRGPVGRAAAAKTERMLPGKLPPPQQPDRTPMIMYPTLVMRDGVEAEMLTPKPATFWPRLIDVDDRDRSAGRDRAGRNANRRRMLLASA